MKNKYFAMGSMVVLMAGPAFAWRPVVIPQAPTLTRLEKLEIAVRQDQEMIERSGAGEKATATAARQSTGRVKLAQDQAALEAFKTAGPNADLQAAVQEDRAEIAAAASESKLILRQARIAAAQKKLAVDEAALSATK